MKFKTVRTVSVSCVFRQVSRQIDYADGIEWAFLKYQNKILKYFFQSDGSLNSALSTQIDE